MGTVKRRFRRQQKETNSQTGGQMRVLTMGTVIAIALIAMIWIGWTATQGSGTPSQQPRANFVLDDRPYLGSAQAPVKIVVFGDYKCPFCRLFEMEVLPQIEQAFIVPGHAQLYFLNYPFIGTDSWTAAMVGESVFRQNSEEFWPYFRAVYENQGDESREWATRDFLYDLVRTHAPGIDLERVESDLNSNEIRLKVEEDYAQGRRAGVQGVPAVFINGVLMADASWSTIEEAINRQLAASGQ